MALAVGDVVVPAGIFVTANSVADLSVGSLCPDGVLTGVFTNGDGYVDWMNGTTGVAFDTGLLRKVSAYSGPDLLGRTVQLPGKPSAFRGTVVQQLDIELATTDGGGPGSPVIVVKGQGFFYATEPSSVEEVV